jgi:hypothetical protein
MLRTVAILLTLALASCDVDLFGLDAKHIAGPYNLTLTDVPDHCAVELKHDFITSNLEVIGWRKPVILCKAYESNTWDVIDTTAGTQSRISEAERRANPLYSAIDVRPAIDAWKSLKRHKRVW